MKKITTILFSLVCLMVSCQKYDDTALRETIEDHEARLQKLELLCNQMNQDIKTYQNVLNAIEKREYITRVTPHEENGVIIGQTIVLSSGKELFIRFGKDGKDGNTDAGNAPLVSVMQKDDVWYWAINGELLLDENGEPVRCSGNDGNQGMQGAVPQITVADGHWWVSYGNGEKKDLGPVKDGPAGQNGQLLPGEQGPEGGQGPQGQPGPQGERGDLMFKEVVVEGNEVKITDNLGHIFRLPYQRTEKLSIAFSTSDNIHITPGETVSVDYTISGTDKDITISALCEHGWKAKVITLGKYSGSIKITAPAKMIGNEVVIMVNEKDGATIISTLKFTGKEKSPCPDTEIWLKLYPGVTPIFGTEGKNNVPIDLTKDFKISETTNARGFHVCTRTDGQKFTEVVDFMFRNSKAIEEAILPNSIKRIGYQSFGGCNPLKKIFLPEGLETISEMAFHWCDQLLAIDLPESLLRIEGKQSLSNLRSIKEITIPARCDASNAIRLLTENIEMETVTIKTPKVGDGWFMACNKLTTVKYLSVQPCPDFKNILDIEGMSENKDLILNQVHAGDVVEGNKWMGCTWKSITLVDENGTPIQ